MKLAKLALATVVGLSFSASIALASYNVGFKYYKKTIFKKTHIKAPKFVKLLGVQTIDELKALFKDNGKPLIEKLKATGHEKAAKQVEVLIKKHKLKDLEDFLVGIMEGKIPASCS